MHYMSNVLVVSNKTGYFSRVEPVPCRGVEPRLSALEPQRAIPSHPQGKLFSYETLARLWVIGGRMIGLKLESHVLHLLELIRHRQRVILGELFPQPPRNSVDHIAHIMLCRPVLSPDAKHP